MTRRLRPSALLTYILLITQKVPCMTLKEASTTKNTSDASSLRTHEIAGRNPEPTNKLNTILQHAKSETPALSNNNLTSQSSPELAIKNMELFQYAVNATNSRSNGNTTEHLELTQRRNLNLLYKTKPPEKKIRYRRAKDKSPPSQSELQPEGYIYDLNRCQYVDDRVLCGYDKNPEEPRKKEIIDLDDICRKHGDRIECGYVTGPYPDPYNPDPEKDKIAKINLANYYNNIARSGGNLDINDTNYDDSEALRMGNGSNSLLNEIIKLRVEMSKLVAALPRNTNIHSATDGAPNTTPYTIPTSTRTAASTTNPANLSPEPSLSLSEILQLRSGTTSKLKLSHLMTETEVTNPTHFGKKSEKKCVEKDGRIYCRTILI
ncbi:uncharacterized protein LOC134798302 isoform X2 [Cydia splendana]|uniref:uncharacterized protein LOC134798302 isoform X2 n=1 Tax=Cydia splendana TaxID=1100963 RepID=UPI00300D4220